MCRIYDESRIHRSWRGLFSPDILRMLDALEGIIGSEYCPRPEEVLRFAETDLDFAKIIILGQDPYAKAGLSTGRAFEVAGIENWSEKNINSSLRNIARGVYRAFTGESKKFAQVREEIESGRFGILPPNELFGHWEKQGVLLINAYPTCKAGSPKSHFEIWRPFSTSLLRFIAARRPDAVWFLWGKEAALLWDSAINSFAVKRDEYITHVFSHPSSVDRACSNSFIDGDCFEIAKSEFGIDWTGVDAEV